MIYSLIISFVLTMIIEYIIVRLLYGKEKILKAVFLVNILTNPLVVYTYNMLNIFSIESKDIILLILEILVVFVEAYVYKLLLNTKYLKAMQLSFFANVIAYLTGLLFW